LLLLLLLLRLLLRRAHAVKFSSLDVPEHLDRVHLLFGCPLEESCHGDSFLALFASPQGDWPSDAIKLNKGPLKAEVLFSRYKVIGKRSDLPLLIRRQCCLLVRHASPTFSKLPDLFFYVLLGPAFVDDLSPRPCSPAILFGVVGRTFPDSEGGISGQLFETGVCVHEFLRCDVLDSSRVSKGQWSHSHAHIWRARPGGHLLPWRWWRRVPVRHWAPESRRRRWWWRSSWRSHT
jgi:hypothetical protein